MDWYGRRGAERDVCDFPRCVRTMQDVLYSSGDDRPLSVDRILP